MLSWHRSSGSQLRRSSRWSASSRTIGGRDVRELGSCERMKSEYSSSGPPPVSSNFLLLFVAPALSKSHISAGIGRSIALQYARRGAFVCIVARREHLSGRGLDRMPGRVRQQWTPRPQDRSRLRLSRRPRRRSRCTADRWVRRRVAPCCPHLARLL